MLGLKGSSHRLHIGCKRKTYNYALEKLVNVLTKSLKWPSPKKAKLTGTPPNVTSQEQQHIILLGVFSLNVIKRNYYFKNEAQIELGSIKQLTFFFKPDKAMKIKQS